MQTTTAMNIENIIDW